VERRVHQPAKLSPSSDNNNNNNNNNNTDNNNDNINASQDVDIAITAAATDLNGAGAVIQTTPQPGKGLVPPFTVTLEGDDYSYKDAIARTLGWVGAATIFGGALWAFGGSEMGEEFFAGYIVEQSLSVDNLFVFLLLFEYFKIPLPSQDRVLNWGIYGAIVMRAIMIGLGAAALKNFHQILLVFAAILVYGSAKFFIGQWSGKDGDEDEEDDPSQNSIVRLARSIYPSTDTFDGNRFFTMIDGIRTATPLFICCVAVEISDVVFAVDSIPAVFGVTEVSYFFLLLV
jgi:TerC family integral membrane protein